MKPTIFCLLYFIFLVPCTLHAEDWLDFRVNNTVRNNNDSEPISDGKTIFFEGRVYDHLTNLHEIIVYNPSRNRFYILNYQLKKKVIITTDETDTYVEQLRQWAATHEDPNIRFFAAPKFEVSYSETEKKYTFSSKLLSYEVTPLKPEHTEILSQYRQFARAYCKLNLMLSPGSKSIFGRMSVNDTIFNSGSLLAQSKITFTSSQNNFFNKNTTIISDYQFLPRLVESDRQWIHQVDEYIVSFSEISLKEYKKLLSTPK